MIALGSSDMAKAYVGSNDVSKVYLGSELVYTKEVLPYDAEVEYLRSDGNQYIDTGFIPTNNCGIYIQLRNGVVATSSKQVMGAVGDGTDSRWNINVSSGNHWTVNYNTANSYKYADTSLFHEIKMNYLNDRHIYIDGVDKRDLSSVTLNNVARTVSIFKTHTQSGYSAAGFIGDISKVKFSSGSNVAMDFIPVRIGQVGYLYDKVSGNLFGNSGTGSFTLGNDI